ncbi:MAG: ornithine--oxo-acid transaminase [Bdellovibrionota bacterium]|nr:MAG: ornithine--oxo-acid transaminase [Bdellovibrionota bacterium]
MVQKRSSKQHIELTETFGAHNYAPLEVVLSRGEGAWVWDVEGKRYLDMLSAYSALNFGHCHPRIQKTAHAQLDLLTLTSRAFYNDTLGVMCEKLATLCGMEQVLLMNSGAEAVETAIKMARRWGYREKGIPRDKAEIICFSNNFHGRTTTIVGMSTSESSRADFGPFTPGFVVVPFNDKAALDAAITRNTCAVLIEPIQGEAGIIIPDSGFLSHVRAVCTGHNALMIADEIQTGLCRTGKIFACNHEAVIPDAYLLGKSLGGGITPISAVVSSRSVMQVFTPGSHGSTFGGNPLACAVAETVLDLIIEERPHERAAKLGAWFVEELRGLNSPYISAVRGRGLLIGVDILPEYGKAKDFCHALLDVGLLCKDTREQTIRFAPPLIISEEDLRWALERIALVFARKDKVSRAGQPCNI